MPQDDKDKALKVREPIGGGWYSAKGEFKLENGNIFKGLDVWTQTGNVQFYLELPDKTSYMFQVMKSGEIKYNLFTPETTENVNGALLAPYNPQIINDPVLALKIYNAALSVMGTNQPGKFSMEKVTFTEGQEFGNLGLALITAINAKATSPATYAAVDAVLADIPAPLNTPSISTPTPKGMVK